MISYRDVLNGFKALNIEAGRPAIVHASLSSFGEVRGGAETLLGALVTAFSGVMMPTFTYKSMLIPEAGPEENGMLYGSARLAEAETRGGIEARFVRGALAQPPRCELRFLRGEPLLLVWYAHRDGEAVRAINRVHVEDGRIALLQNYFFNADFIAEVCAELGVPCRVNGYKFWIAGC